MANNDYEKRIQLMQVATHCESAARHFAMATADSYSGQKNSTWRDMAIVDMTNAADALGFDLVKRQTPAEMHDAAIATRVSEDIEWSR